jgi:rhodanese-related sulfurtransferase
VPEQIDQSVFEAVVFIDARDPEQFAEGTIPGAISIQWREVLGRIDEIPSDKKVITFCTAGSRPAQAAFALRVTGRENVLLLQTGLNGWNEKAA